LTRWPILGLRAGGAPHIWARHDRIATKRARTGRSDRALFGFLPAAAGHGLYRREFRSRLLATLSAPEDATSR
jgi:hypothetical protein